MKIIRSENPAAIRHGWVILALLALVVAALGGSSRADAPQIVGLRPLAALFLVPAIYWLDRSKLRDIRIPAVLLAILAVWMAIQLIPLPPGLWQALPGREPLAELGAALGITDVWRPISMVPARTLNALASLVVPIAGLLLVAATGVSRRTLLLLLIGIGVLDAMLGILQVTGGNAAALYFYQITNFGSPVGFFANHNHSAVMSALTLVLIAYCATMPELAFHGSMPRIGFAILYLVVLVAALIGGSRAGLLTTLVAVGASLAMLAIEVRRLRRQRRRVSETTESRVSPGLVLGVALAALGAMIALFALSDRIPALDRIASTGTFEDLRWGLLPTLREMIATYGLFGSGFGSFEEVYHIHEPDSLMISSYVNMAHNDWAQLIIEGGVPAVFLIVALLAWLGRSLGSVLGGGAAGVARMLLWLSVAGILLFASLVDYPLRTPLFQLFAVWLVAIFAIERSTYREGS
ncbi:O-antigen ligase family protein [Parerythrobacter lacustris]|uniref:O-antigen ligase family protein n=1 Tax=Parerythrobacter lacustris TaxID=2969984 RepID=A0ABT1XVC5_9SPHN|nr:O-antigen ligase family protein [Parerythrobacter lacustris]MCR2834392.1 O-antigen ligase family protein [Parerythrobacter lacustris]